MGSRTGALRTAARRTGLTPEEYEAKRAAGERWCTACKCWHPLENFGLDANRADGISRICQQGKNSKARASYEPRLRPRAGRTFVARRDGDKKQARGRVNYLVNVGLIPSPNDLPCTDCGHVWTIGGRRHEYDHYLGYAAEHHEHVEAVCTTCHHAREATRESASGSVEV